GVGSDQHIAYGTVFAAQLGGVLLNVFAPVEPIEHRRDGVLIDMELGDLVPDVFLSGVSEQFQFGTVRTEDGATGVDPVEPLTGVVKEIREFAFASTQRFLGLRALGELPDLAANRGKHLKKIFVRLSGLPTEAFDDTKHLLAQSDGKTN